MLNTWTGAGRITKPLELKTTQSGVPFLNFTIAIDRDYKNGDEKETDFVDVSAYRATAEYLSKYADKGRMVIVNGRLQSRKYQDKDGNNRTAWSIQANNVYLVGGGGNSSDTNGSASNTPRIRSMEEILADTSDESLPF